MKGYGLAPVAQARKFSQLQQKGSKGKFGLRTQAEQQQSRLHWIFY